jgi:hypothetical protein
MVINKAGSAILYDNSSLGEILTQLRRQAACNAMAYTGPIVPSCIGKFDSNAQFFILFSRFGGQGASLQGSHRVTSSVIATSS